MSIPIIAIVGRSNVGKSTLFNRLIGTEKAIVENTPGVTRDRNYGQCEWNGKLASIIDTGGIELFSDDIILKKMKQQIDVAIEQADVIIFVVDLKLGVTSIDIEIAEMLRKTNKSILVAVNKCDNLGKPQSEFYEFHNLGFSDLFEISAAHGYGIGNLLDAAFEKISFENSMENETAAIKVAIVGKTNVGKSSLVNKIVGEERSIVSDIAGTTRDMIDSSVENSYGSFIFIDTAGIRKKKKIEESIEYYSVIRAFRAIEKADVCLVLIDAEIGFTEQDSKIAGYANEKGKNIIIVVNKWDKIAERQGKAEEYKSKLQIDFAFISYVPIVFLSAKTGQGLVKVFEMINYVYEQSMKRITTGILNIMLAETVAKMQPPTDKGKCFKIYYITQVGIKPPTFIMFVNNINLLHFSYKRYIENQIRETFKLTATPIRLLIRERKKKGN